MYNPKVLDHFLHPRNMGVIKNPDAEAQVGNPICGDVMKLYLKIKKKGGKAYITEAKFQTLGCAAAIATTSVLTQMVKGKTVEEAQKIQDKDIVERLGGLPPFKLHCSLLAVQALKKALNSWLKKEKRKRASKRNKENLNQGTAREQREKKD